MLENGNQVPDSTNDQETTPESEKSSIPKKFEGKSLEEVVASYSSLESELGRARNEIGTMRRLTDELLGLRRPPAEDRINPEPPPKITTDQLFEDPTEAVLTVAKRTADEATARTEKRVGNLELFLQTESFKRDFADYESTMNAPEFQDWVRGSPYRQRLALSAAGNDFDAARELFGLYKESAPKTPAPSNRTQPSAADVALARGGGSNAAGVANTSTGQKIFSRDELINMRIYEPEKYSSMWPEIFKAYQEKRVR